MRISSQAIDGERMKKSFVWMTMAVLVAVASLAACSRSPAPVPQFKLRLGFFPVPDYLPFFIMQVQGFDKQNGIQFEKQPYPGGSAIIQAMAAGALDVGYVGSVPVFSAAERGLIPGTVIPVAASCFANPEHPLIGVLAARFVRRWKDLEGKQIGVNQGNSLHSAAVQGRLQQEGVHHCALVEISSANLGLAVAGGNVAAAVMADPFLSQSLLRGDGKFLGWIIGGPPFERMEATLIVCRTRLYRNNPRAIKAILRAHLQAVRWIAQNRENARAIFARQLKLSQEVERRVSLPFWPLDARSDPALLKSIEPILMKSGLLKAPILLSQLYDETLLQEVLAENRP